MLRAGLDTSRLHAENGFICSNASQEGVRTEAFPIATTLGYPTNIHHRTEGNVDPFADMFFTHRDATCADQGTFPSTAGDPLGLKGKPKVRQPCDHSRGCGINSSWESGDEIGKAHSEG